MEQETYPGIKLERLIIISEALQKLAKTKMQAKLGLRVAMNIDALIPVLTAFNTQRTSLMQEHGTISEDGTEYKFEAAGMALFSKDMAEMMAETMTVTFKTIKQDELDGIEVEPEVLVPLLGSVIVP